MGSSFCRLSRVKLQNEDPRLEAETHDATNRCDTSPRQVAATNRLVWHVTREGRLELQNEDPRLNALLDVNWHEMGFCTMSTVFIGLSPIDPTS